MKYLKSALAFFVVFLLSIAPSTVAYEDHNLMIKMDFSGIDSGDDKAIILILWDTVDDRVVMIDGYAKQNPSGDDYYLSQGDTDKDKNVRPWMENYYYFGDSIDRYMFFLIFINSDSDGNGNTDDFSLNKIQITGDGWTSASISESVKLGDRDDTADHIAISYRILLTRSRTFVLDPISGTEDDGFLKAVGSAKIDSSRFDSYYRAIWRYYKRGANLEGLIFDLSVLNFHGWETTSSSSSDSSGGSGGGSGGGGSWNIGD